MTTDHVTLLLSDIEGSTRLWESDPPAMASALESHDSVIADAVASADGRLIKERGEGDSAFAVFDDPLGAVRAALLVQRELQGFNWPPGVEIKVRMAIHSGAPEARGGDFYGPEVNRTARIRGAGHGGQVLVSEASADLVMDRLPEGATLRDLGRHRLRDLTHPERIYQLEHDSLATDFPPLRARDAVRHNLKLQMNSFLGRNEELDDLLVAIRSSRLVTVTGVGGAGKTRLALHAAAALMDEFEDGVWLVELASVTEPSLVPNVVAGVLRVSEEPDLPLDLALRRHLAQRETLLVLDNCEQVIEGCSALVRSLVERCSDLRVLATSREPLAIPGEAIFRIGPLMVPPSDGDPERLEAYPASGLLLDRARALRSDLEFSREELVIVGEMSRQLDGLPLAIELAASRIAVLGARRSMERLQELLSAPASGAAVNVPHHRSLTAALDWSYELLDDDEKALFARVSVFSGSFTSEAVEEVCGGFPTQRPLDDLVTSLVHKSLLVAERSPVEPRFRLLLVVKAFAESKLSPDDATILEERYVDRYRSLASLAREGLKGPETGYWLDLIAAEYDDFSNAIDRAGGPDRLEILAGLRRFWLLRGHWSEGLTRMRAAVEELPPSPVEPWIQTVIGVGALAQAKGDYKLAEKMYRQGLEAAAEAGLIEQEGYAENAIAMIALQQGSQDAARSHFEASLRLLKESGAHWATAGVLNNLGALAQSEGDLASARDLYQEALDTAKRLGDLSSAAICLNNLAEIAQGRDDLAEASDLLTESLQIARGLEDRHAIAVALNNLGITESAGGDTEGAEEHFREGIKVAAEIADEQAVRTGLEGLAATATAMGDQERASTLRGAASRLASPVVSGDQPVIDLGRDEDAFARGAGMGLDEAVTFALQGPGSRSPRR